MAKVRKVFMLEEENAAFLKEFADRTNISMSGFLDAFLTSIRVYDGNGATEAQAISEGLTALAREIR